MRYLALRLSKFKKKNCVESNYLVDYNRPILAYKNGEKIDELNFINNIYKIDAKLLNKEWSVNIKLIDVIYDNNFIKRNPVISNTNSGEYITNLSILGTVKSEAWKFEDETRMIANLRYINNKVDKNIYDFLLVPIKFDNIEKIEITFGPWMTDTLKDVVKDLFLSYLDGINYNVKNSIFDKVI